MQRELLILRHAKSDWSASYSSDWERPINKRGKQDAQLVGEWLKQQQLFPDLILCSPARRARDTLRYLVSRLDRPEIETGFPKSLYLADLDTLLATIQGISDDSERILLVGHNPGLEELVLYLSKKRPPLNEKGKLFTTANLAVFDLADGYQHIKPHVATLTRLVRPVDLKSES